MTFTIWEKQLLNTAVQADTHPHRSKIRMSLGLEDKLSLSDSEKKLYNQPGLTEEPKEIFEKTSEVPLTVAEVGYILELLDSEKMGLPKRIETLDLCEKLEKVKNGQNEV